MSDYTIPAQTTPGEHTISNWEDISVFGRVHCSGGAWSKFGTGMSWGKLFHHTSEGITFL